MDIEKGSQSLLSTSSGSNRTPKLLVAVSILISSLALAGTLVLIVQNQQMQADMNRLTSQDSTQNPNSAHIPDLAARERALREVSVIAMAPVNKAMPGFIVISQHSVGIGIGRCMFLTIGNNDYTTLVA